MLFWDPINIFNLAGIVAGIVYLVDVLPRDPVADPLLRSVPGDPGHQRVAVRARGRQVVEGLPDAVDDSGAGERLSSSRARRCCPAPSPTAPRRSRPGASPAWTGRCRRSARRRRAAGRTSRGWSPGRRRRRTTGGANGRGSPRSPAPSWSAPRRGRRTARPRGTTAASRRTPPLVEAVQRLQGRVVPRPLDLLGGGEDPLDRVTWCSPGRR